MTGASDPAIGCILLAAGGSTRFGRPKQLVEFEGEQLLRRAAAALLETVYRPLIAVLGASFDETKRSIADLPVEIAVNKNWQNGMGSSIGEGLHRLLQIDPDTSAVLITLCDQPLVTSEHLGLFAAMYAETDRTIIASAYGETVGVPALFSKELFNHLLALDGDKGARTVIKAYSDSIATIDLPEAAFDIDTEADIRRVLAVQNQ